MFVTRQSILVFSTLKKKPRKHVRMSRWKHEESFKTVQSCSVRPRQKMMFYWKSYASFCNSPGREEQVPMQKGKEGKRHNHATIGKPVTLFGWCPYFQFWSFNNPHTERWGHFWPVNDLILSAIPRPTWGQLVFIRNNYK